MCISFKNPTCYRNSRYSFHNPTNYRKNTPFRRLKNFLRSTPFTNPTNYRKSTLTEDPGPLLAVGTSSTNPANGTVTSTEDARPLLVLVVLLPQILPTIVKALLIEDSRPLPVVLLSQILRIIVKALLTEDPEPLLVALLP